MGRSQGSRTVDPRRKSGSKSKAVRSKKDRSKGSEKQCAILVTGFESRTDIGGGRDVTTESVIWWRTTSRAKDADSAHLVPNGQQVEGNRFGATENDSPATEAETDTWPNAE